MTDHPSTDQALGWLTEQLGALSRLRNSSPRSHEFKQWRQATLTAVQRIWPGDSPRSERFRRIPFSAGPKSTERSSHEAFDHGCSEARRIIRLWVAEIKHHGIEQGEVETPRIDPALEEARAKGRLKEMLGFEIPLAPPAPEPQAVDEHIVPDARDAAAHKKRPRQRAPQAPQPAAPPSTPLAIPAQDVVRLDQTASSESILVDKRPAELHLESPSPEPPVSAEPPVNLGDLLGQSIAEALERVKDDVVPEEASTDGTPTPASSQTDAAPASMSPLARPAAITEAPVAPGEVTQVEPARAEPAHVAPVELARVEPARAEPVRVAPIEAARIEPARAEPVRVAPVREIDPVLVATAHGIGALATDAELDRLGVPAADRQRVGTALSRFVQRVHSGELDWSGLRETMAVVMDHPALARRAMPLLHSFFEAAA